MKLLATSEDERRVRHTSDARARAIQNAFQRWEINLSRRSSGTYAAPRCCHGRGGLQAAV